MLSIRKCPVPADSLVAKYSREGAYIDCYSTDVAGHVSLAEFVFEFYTTALFRLERFILAKIISRPSTEGDARELANGLVTTFAAWDVESRRSHEILLRDMIGRTRSWLMAVPVADDRTRLYFGSAVVPVRNPKTGGSALGFVYQSLLGFHQIYSVLLLYSAKLRLNSKSKNRGEE